MSSKTKILDFDFSDSSCRRILVWEIRKALRNGERLFLVGRTEPITCVYFLEGSVEVSFDAGRNLVAVIRSSSVVDERGESILSRIAEVQP